MKTLEFKNRELKYLETVEQLQKKLNFEKVDLGELELEIPLLT